MSCSTISQHDVNKLVNGIQKLVVAQTTGRMLTRLQEKRQADQLKKKTKRPARKEIGDLRTKQTRRLRLIMKQSNKTIIIKRLPPEDTGAVNIRRAKGVILVRRLGLVKVPKKVPLKVRKGTKAKPFVNLESIVIQNLL